MKTVVAISLLCFPISAVAQDSPKLFFGVGLTGITSEQAIPTGYSVAFGVIKNRLGFSGTFGYSESELTLISRLRSITVLTQPLARIKENFYLGFGPQLRITTLVPVDMGYAISTNLKAADIIMLSISWSSFDAFGLSANLLF